MQVEMEPLPSLLVSFSDALETRVCGREACGREYTKCTPDEKSKWQFVGSSRNTNGVVNRWACGDCMVYYSNKQTVHRRGMKS
jgi:hypothetical protein